MQKIKYSFEFFPAKTKQAEDDLWQAIKRLEPLAPEFVSVTYGAGGSTQSKTLDTITKIKQNTNLTPASHLTCVGATQEQINKVADDIWNAGIKHIVALRGDMPGHVGEYTPHPGGYPFAVDLVQGLRKLHDFKISVAAYPEKHPQATSLEQDIVNLKLKLDAGANQAITQYFFEADTFFKFRDACAEQGITKPIIPGILPVYNFEQTVKFSKACQTTVPQWFYDKLDGVDNEQDRYQICFEIFKNLHDDLVAGGVEELHIYTLNRAGMVLDLLVS